MLNFLEYDGDTYMYCFWFFSKLLRAIHRVDFQIENNFKGLLLLMKIPKFLMYIFTK